MQDKAARNKIGYIGLGKMGKNMILRLLDQRVEVVAWNRSQEPRNELAAKNLEVKIATSLADLVSKLEAPRIIWLMLTSGEAVDEVMTQLDSLLSAGDLLIDGGNSFYKDSLRRYHSLSEKGIHFIDVGTSGGPAGARNGACLMVGGSRQDFEIVKPILEKIAAPNSLAFLGGAGAGHFAKMVHNGIEYGMMESLAEGVAVLQKSQFNFDLTQVLNLYNHKSVIESRLVGWAEEVLADDPKLSKISSKIAHSGEGEWTIKTAKELRVKVPAIEASFTERVMSSQDSDSFKDKIVSALRGKFGGHDVKLK